MEQRPWIREIGGKRRFFWLTTIVTKEEGDNQNFIAGSIPDLVLTDAEYNIPVWVDPLRPESWESQVAETYGTVWK